MANAGELGDLPLAGVRVIDVSTTFSGPYCSYLMAQLGADVIKVEAPGGDIIRGLTPGRHRNMSSMFINLNHGKRSIVLDLKQEPARVALRRLTAGADVFLHNVRAEPATRLGLDYEGLAAQNPGLVHCVVQGYGEGPYSQLPAYDDTIQAAAGFADVQGHAVGRPTYMASIVADKTSGLVAMNAILAALFQRSRTGRGQSIQVPMFEVMVAWLLVEQIGGMAFEPPAGPVLYPRAVSEFRRPYRTKDGYLGALIYTDEQWRRFLTLVGRADLVDTGMFATAGSRTASIDEVYSFVEQQLSLDDNASWIRRLSEIDVPVVPMNGVADLFTDPHLVAGRFCEVLEHPTEGAVRVLRPPVRFADQQAAVPQRFAPTLGQHTEEVLAEIGMSAEDLAPGQAS